MVERKKVNWRVIYQFRIRMYSTFDWASLPYTLRYG